MRALFAEYERFEGKARRELDARLRGNPVAIGVLTEAPCSWSARLADGRALG